MSYVYRGLVPGAFGTVNGGGALQAFPGFIVKADSTAGPVTVPVPPLPKAGMFFGVADDGGHAPAHAISVVGAAAPFQLESPDAPGTYADSVAIDVASQVNFWLYTGTAWKLVFQFAGAVASGPSSFLARALPFAFDTPSGPIGSVPGGSTMVRASALVTTPFNDPSASLAFGLVGGSASAFLGPGDSALASAGQYDSELLESIGSPDMMQLTIVPGASTQGAGLLFFELAT